MVGCRGPEPTMGRLYGSMGWRSASSRRACGHCDACRLRAEGFAAAGVADPTRYR